MTDKYLDSLFREYLLTIEAQTGWGRCFTCDVPLKAEYLQVGHFCKRRHLNTRWHEMNCHLQCDYCNVTLDGNMKVYEIRMAKKYGQYKVDALKFLAQQRFTGDKKEIARELKEKINERKNIISLI